MKALLALWIPLLVACVPALLEPVPVGPIPESTLEDQGLDRRYWEAMLKRIQREDLPVDGVALGVGSRMLAQQYFGGHTPGTPHDLRSSTKGITSLLVGIALDKGLIASLDAPVRGFFPEYTPHPSWQGRRPLTLRSLLTMQSGLDCNDERPASGGNEEWMYRTGDWLEFFFAIPAQGDPGQTFSYCTAGVVVLGEIVARAAKRPLPEFAREVLFEPLEVLEAHWAPAPEGVTDAGGHLTLTPQSMLKIGMMVQAGGVWRGRRIVSEGWLKEMLEPQPTPLPGFPELRYGYLWWLQPVREGKVLSYQTRGNGGQFIMVVPQYELVVAFTGRAYNSPQAQVAFELMQRYLIPMAARVPFAPTP